MRELSVEAASETLTNDQRSALDEKLQGLLREYDRISRSTEFNQLKLLDGSFEDAQIQYGSGRASALHARISLSDSTDDATFRKNFGTGVFTTEQTVSVGNTTWESITADINGDGHLDLITSSEASGYLSIFKGRGDGTFQSGGTVEGGDWGLTLGDLDADGDLDMVVGQGTTSVLLFENDGSGNFSRAETVLVGDEPYDVDLADVNGDGKLNLISTANKDNEVRVNLGLGGFSFDTNPASFISVGSAPEKSTVVDINGDGYLDISTVNFSSNNISIAYGDGTGNFLTRQTLAVLSGPADLEFADLDGDNDQDLVVSYYTAQKVQSFTNNGAGTFTLVTSEAIGGELVSLTLADMNNDGHLDAVTSNYSSGDQNILYGNGAGGFNRGTTVSVTDGGYAHAVGDFNEDGVNDIFFTNVNGMGTVVLQDAVERTAVSMLELSSSGRAAELIDLFDDALERLFDRQSRVNALLSRFEFVAAGEEVAVEYLSSALNIITETDYALEVAEMTKAQMLQSVSATVLTQANLQTQLVLNLLKLNG